ncbi:MAG: hypothetical protein JXR37_34075 [Kiritimatiellae bacterium]|nr:hypothetical protein [Kiritimatiellia bacterium]
MKARLVPVTFESGEHAAVRKQLDRLAALLAGEADVLEPVPLGAALPAAADAALFPQLVGEAYGRVDALRRLGVPGLVLTSEFGTMAMWDWELVAFLRGEGVALIAPYDPAHTRTVCRALALKRDLPGTTFVVYQDNPGDGFQADIFRRFYWWEQTCLDAIGARFGVTVAKRSFKGLAEKSRRISDEELGAVRAGLALPAEGVSERALDSALRLYLALKRDVDGQPGVRGVGINCLNESHVCDTTPCLAWNMLYEESGLIWACEADVVSLLTQVLASRSLDTPVLMTNIYPFLMGMAALKHEHIDAFPPVPDPEQHALLAHCGYLGVVPRSQAVEWTLRRRVLDIVDENATAIDARLPTGPLTLFKLSPGLDTIMAGEVELEGYVQYPHSHCRNGGLIRVPDGPALMNKLYSHHQCFVTGRRLREIELVARVFDLNVERI